MKSKLEQSLAEALDFASRNENAPWPYPAPVRWHHFLWCCEHRKAAHRRGVHCVGCCDVPGFICDPSGAPCGHAFAKERDWEFDFAWPSLKVAVECEGGGWTGGRHTRGAGFAADLEKYSQAELAGWHVIRVSQREITSGVALTLIENALKAAS